MLKRVWFIESKIGTRCAICDEANENIENGGYCVIKLKRNAKRSLRIYNGKGAHTRNPKERNGA